MSLVSPQTVEMQNSCATEINTSMTRLLLCQNNMIIQSEKVTDTGAGSKSTKILQYGSRHTIQNTGWTTRLSCDPLPRRNAVYPLPSCDPLPAGNAVHSIAKLPLPPLPGKSIKPVYPRLPFLSISRPTVLKLQSSVPDAKTGMSIQVVDSTDNQSIGLQPAASSSAQCTVASGELPTILTQAHMSVGAAPTSTTSLLNHAVLTMPTVNSLSTGGKPPTVCFIPISSVICGPVCGLPISKIPVMGNVPGSYAMVQTPASLDRAHQLNLGPLLTSYAAVGSKTAVTAAAMNPLSSTSLVSPKELETWTSDGRASNVRILDVKVHIDHGRITEVQEVSDKQQRPNYTSQLLTVDFSSNAVFSGDAVDHVDTNGAQFGYFDLADGRRIRIARDTSGQRHAPFFLLAPKDEESCPLEECTVEIKTGVSAELPVPPDEADLSEVGTIFTYEPVFISEQTLVPVPRRKMRPRESVAGLSEDESQYYYRCYLCSFFSDDHAKVCKHWVNVHLMDLPYHCPYCERTFFTSTRAQVHVICQHRGSRLTKVGFQRSSSFANTLSYEIGESETDESSDSDEGEEQEIVLDQCDRRRTMRADSVFRCQACRFQTRSSVEMRQHLKFVHGHGHFKLLRSGYTEQQQQEVQSSSAQSRGVQAEIAWSNISEKLDVAGECRYQCRWCAFQAKTTAVISLHVLQEHHWPSAVLCPSCSCSLQLTDEDRNSTSVVCSSCKAKILLAPATDSSALPETQDTVYMCNICAFKTQGKRSMCRHIKYNHTKCRPFTCVYCNYVAVERAQVEMHIVNHHSGQSVIVKERTEANDQFRHILNNLFPKLVSVEAKEAAGLQVNEDSNGSESDSSRPMLSTDVGSPLFTCEECKYETSSLEQLIRHQHRFHKNTLAANAAMIPAGDKMSIATAAPPGEHFKCKICGYCCLDRSSMSRHVKYMHITARPHSCVYCSYNNVEKTKVRLHVMAHHPGRPRTVRTDRRILDEMSQQAKDFYNRIDGRGHIIDESSGSIMNRNGSSASNRPATSSDSSDNELPEDLLTHDGHTNTVDSGLVKEEENMGDYEDDVDIGFYPRRNNIDGHLVNSVVALDHSYVRILTPDDYAAVSADITIKQEPLDGDYDDVMSGVLHSEFDGRYTQQKNGGCPEVKSETADDLYSATVDSLDSEGLSDSDQYTDDSYDSERNDDMDPFDSEHSSDNESFAEPARKKTRVAFGVDPTSEESMTVGSVVIDTDVWEDPKMHMTPVVELEDVLQIILAWQQNAGETGDIL